MKQILLFTVLLVGAGCKVTQPPAGQADLQPGTRIVSSLEDRSHTPANDATTPAGATKAPGEPASPDGVTPADGTAPADGLTPPGETAPTDTVALPGGLLLPDSTALANRIAHLDSLPADTVPKKKGVLEAEVDYRAMDSIVWTAGNLVYMYGEGDVKYQKIELKADYMRMKVDSSLLYATHSVDSLGEEAGFPVFSEGDDQELEAREMFYNFKTRKAFAKKLVTQQGEGFVISERAKKTEDNVMYMENGQYTTCDHEHPHFFINLTKAKVRTGKDIVTGPAYLVVEDVPLFPLVLPFAFFPFTDSYSSGILMPTYGDEMSRGFFLRDGGYYFALSDYFDLALIGEIYTKGSWGLSGQTSYKKRYKYSGKFDLAYNVTKTGDKGMDDYSESTAFKVRWSHSQDPLSNPFRTFSSSVDYSTNNFDRKNLSSMHSPASSQNNKGSSVSLTQRFPNKPFSISATMNINQRSQDSSVSVTLPDLTLNLSRIYPLKRKNAIGRERWYEKISMTYTGYLRNNINTKDNLLFKSSLVKDWKNGMQHTIPVSATYTFLDHLNISPSVNYSERWYTNRIDREYDRATGRMMPSDTTYGFYRLYEYSASVSASTTLYGEFLPIKFLQRITKITKIRHRFEPSVSFSARPDFGDPKYGYYNYYTIRDETDPSALGGGKSNTVSGYYSPFEGQLFGVPGRGKSGSVAFSVNNNIEAKKLDENEESGLKKISIVDNLSGSMSYNLAADSLQWSDLSASLRLKLTKSYTLNLNAMFDTYTYAVNERGQPYKVNKPRWTVGKGFGRLRSTGTSFSYTFNNDTFKKLFGGDDDSGSGKKKGKPGADDELTDPDDYDPNDPFNTEEDVTPETEKNEKGGSLLNRKKKTEGEYDEDGYYNVTIPWSLSFNYNLTFSYADFNLEKLEYNRKLTHSLSFNGNLQPTKNWRINFSGTYDFDNRKVVGVRGTISRSMHCFQMSASIIPMGPLKSYSFSISANSSMLKDLKYDQSSSQYNGQSWY
ncbi:MAG: LPS-assembly protein LptD [Tannerella sp.]|nr:LPS-assembly protein LptD [Tannerella sp.]